MDYLIHKSCKMIGIFQGNDFTSGRHCDLYRNLWAKFWAQSSFLVFWSPNQASNNDKQYLKASKCAHVKGFFIHKHTLTISHHSHTVQK